MDVELRAQTLAGTCSLPSQNVSVSNLWSRTYILGRLSKLWVPLKGSPLLLMATISFPQFLLSLTYFAWPLLFLLAMNNSVGFKF